MWTVLKRWLGHLAIVAASVAVTLLVCELVVFRFVLVPDDVLQNVSLNGVVRYAPNSEATFRHPDASETHVTINSDGWNSSRPTYTVAKKPGILRVAVVGDSYVHGAFVDTGDGFPEVLEASLKAGGANAEVYRFGMDGAPLSQYLQVIRSEALRYRPDIVVVQLIHNDFDESFRWLGTRYNSSFLKLAIDDNGAVKELQPDDFETGGVVELMRNFNTFRYLYYETGLYLQVKSFTSKYVWGEQELFDPEFISSAVDTRNLADDKRIGIATRYVMRAVEALADANGFKVVFVMDGVREAVYAGKPATDYQVGKLNEVAAAAASELGLPFLDLQQTFAADWAGNKQRFEYSFDWHWNKRANHLVGGAIGRFLLADPRLMTPAGS